MADIKVKDLVNNSISGLDLFEDSENFMMELNDEQERNVLGGMKCDIKAHGAETGCYSGSGWIHTDFM